MRHTMLKLLTGWRVFSWPRLILGRRSIPTAIGGAPRVERGNGCTPDDRSAQRQLGNPSTEALDLLA